MMIKDPIVEEIHRTRERLLKEHGGLRGLAAYMKANPVHPDKPVVSFPPRRPKRKRLASA